MPESDFANEYISDSDSTGTLWIDVVEEDLAPVVSPVLAADVVIDVDAPDLLPWYSYRVPPELQSTVRPGMCVCIPFNRREMLGYVMRLRKISPRDPIVRKLHEITSVLDDSAAINEEQVQLVEWMSIAYVCDPIAAIRCVAPASLGSSLETLTHLTDPMVRGHQVTRSAPQAHIVETLRDIGGESELEALKGAADLPEFASAYAALVTKGVIVQTRRLVAPRIQSKTVRVYALSQYADRKIIERKPGPQQLKVIQVLSERARVGGTAMTYAEIVAEIGVPATSVKTLVERGIITEAERLERRSPYGGLPTGIQAPALSPQQRRASDQIRAALSSRTEQTLLLFGVTASGKTEVYLDAITATLEMGRTAILLVPEIALTAQVVETFVGRFGEQVAVLHSRLSEGERHDEWRRIQQGHAKIVVGARSAIFAPVSNVGLIVLDEEHEASYKQEKLPRYNARELARQRAHISGATLVLGSATPSIETYWATTPEAVQWQGGKKTGTGSSDITRITMSKRIDSRPMPHVEIVDLRDEFKQRPALFSDKLATAIGHRLREGEQTILFLNRRGYSQFVLCRDCGWTARCPNCAVSLAFHSFDQSLKCHHCNYSARTPVMCPDCRGAKVKAFGVGTEKVEEEVLRIYPSARVSRMDRDTTARKGAHGKILKEFREREADILIGTQMVAKGLDFPNVTLVGVITADTAINMPDFRAAERTFQLLTQVAGRAGRGQRPGEVIIQTFSPDHYAVQAAILHDYERFYEQEILFRRELNYPPYSRLANLICAHTTEADARDHASIVAAAILAVKPAQIELIGPSPAPIARIKNHFRYHVALRGPLDAPLSETIREALKRLRPADRKGLSIDMDPLSMS